MFKSLSFYVILACVVFQWSCTKDMGSAKTTGAGGSLARFAIAGNYLYIVDYANLSVYNVSNPAQPEYVTSAHVGFEVETIFPYKDKLFIGGMNGMYIFSISDPAKPVRESSVLHFRACDPVVSNDSMAYVTLRSNGSCRAPRSVLNVYDVRNVKAPLHLKEIGMTDPYGLGLKHDALYVCEGSNGLAVFDLKDPKNPLEVRRLGNETYFDVIPYGDVLIAYIDKGICFFDISEPLKPALLSTLKG